MIRFYFLEGRLLHTIFIAIDEPPISFRAVIMMVRGRCRMVILSLG